MKENITVAIAYASSKPHIGNLYEAVLADCLTRTKRQQGIEVRFQSGTDEHGQKIKKEAEKLNRLPQEHVDIISGIYAEDARKLWVHPDYFIRTTDAGHQKIVQKIFTKLFEQDDIYKGVYQGWYCVTEETYYSQAQLSGDICPHCQTPLIWMEEESYFFRLSRYETIIKNHLYHHPDFILPHSRQKELYASFLDEGLDDVAITRTSFEWGIQVPFDPRHVMYVWFDALCNYITGLGYWVDDEKFNAYWPYTTHLLGKDIVRFHATLWLGMLSALELPFPKQMFAHPWLIVSGQKMSKSKENGIYIDGLLDVFPSDTIRYVLLSEVQYEKDGHISFDLFYDRHNELVNTIGNTVYRLWSMAHQYAGGILDSSESGTYAELAGGVDDLLAQAAQDIAAFYVSRALGAHLEAFRIINQEISRVQPWTLPLREATIFIHDALACVEIIARSLQAFLPAISQAVLRGQNQNGQAMIISKNGHVIKRIAKQKKGEKQ